jgi:hypothetical protein
VLDVCGAHCAVGERCYVVTLGDGTKTHLPVWMTVAEAAHEATLSSMPLVSVAALEAVRSLLDHALRSTTADGHT